MLPRIVADLARGLGQLLYPNVCLICDSPEPEVPPFRHGLCDACRRAVAHDPHDICPRCAATVGPYTDTASGCTACRGQSLGFDAAFRLGPYDGRLRDSVLRMKGSAGEPVGEMLGRVLAEEVGPKLKGIGLEAVVPVPLYWRRRWVRGHNQSEAVSRELAAALGLPHRPRWLRRVQATPQQAQPSAAARRENVKGAFRVKRGASLAGRAVLLVDDVMTTGSTAAEAAKALRAAGAANVVVVVLARR